MDRAPLHIIAFAPDDDPPPQDLQREVERLRSELAALRESQQRDAPERLAELSHDLRTPMNAIIGLSRLLQKTELAPRQRDYVAKVQSSGLHLLRVIDGILGRPTVETVETDPERADLAPPSAPTVAGHVPGIDPMVASGLEAIRGARILLVEDNDIDQEVAREMLQDAGLVVDVAADGEAALSMVQRSPYDLVFMDMQMPVMDGVSATAGIRRLPLLSQLPIVAMTANAMEPDLRRCIDAGMNDFLVKPIDPPTLWNLLLRWIRPAAMPLAGPEGAAGDAQMALPEGIAGLDTALGLSQMMGKRGLYLEMLRRFADTHRGAAEEVSMALVFDNARAAERLAHTAKGMSASIGATAVRDAASELEQGLKEGLRGPALLPSVRAFQAALDALVEALDARL